MYLVLLSMMGGRNDCRGADEKEDGDDAVVEMLCFSTNLYTTHVTEKRLLGEPFVY